MSSPRSARPITPDNDNDLQEPCSKIFVGTAGDLKVAFVKDDPDTEAVTLKNVAAGTVLEISVKRVFATGTTATNLVALYS